MSHVIFLDADEGPSTEEMSLNNRAGMRLQLQLRRRATCALMQEACERRALYAAHDLTPMRTLWTPPPLFIVSAAPHVTYLKRNEGAARDTCDTGTPRTGRAGGEVGERDLTSDQLCWVIHAVTHGAIHSRRSCSGPHAHKKTKKRFHNISSVLGNSSFSLQPPASASSLASPPLGAVLTGRQVQGLVSPAVALVSSEGCSTKICPSHVFIRNGPERSQSASWNYR